MSPMLCSLTNQLSLTASMSDDMSDSSGAEGEQASARQPEATQEQPAAKDASRRYSHEQVIVQWLQCFMLQDSWPPVHRHKLHCSMLLSRSSMLTCNGTATWQAGGRREEHSHRDHPRSERRPTYRARRDDTRHRHDRSHRYDSHRQDLHAIDIRQVDR